MMLWTMALSEQINEHVPSICRHGIANSMLHSYEKYFNFTMAFSTQKYNNV